MSPFFSIIIPTYNRSGFLSTAIQSVLDQTYKEYELIIVDDGSTDNTKKIVQGFNDVRIKYVYQENKGRSVARNYGIKSAKGKHICFLDDDDYFLNNHLEIMHQKINNNKNQIKIITAQYEIESDGVRKSRNQHPAQYPNLVKYIWDAFVPIQSICFPKKVLSKNKFPEGYHIWEDKHLLLRLVLEHPIVYISTVTSVVRDHKERSVNRVVPETFREDSMQMIRTMDNLFETHGLELTAFLSKQDITIKKSQSLIGKALDALKAGERKISWILLIQSIQKYFHYKLFLTYLNTSRKILFH